MFFCLNSCPQLFSSSCVDDRDWFWDISVASHHYVACPEVGHAMVALGLKLLKHYILYLLKQK